ISSAFFFESSFILFLPPSLIPSLAILLLVLLFLLSELLLFLLSMPRAQLPRRLFRFPTLSLPLYMLRALPQPTYSMVLVILLIRGSSASLACPQLRPTG